MTVVFQDPFTGSDLDFIPPHAPSVGTSWTRVSVATVRWFIIQSNQAAPDGNQTSGVPHLFNLANTASALPSDYEVSYEFRVGNGTSGRHAGCFVYYADSDNVYGAVTDADSTLRLIKRVGGSNEELGNSAQAVAAGAIIKLRVTRSGSVNTLKVLYNDIEKIVKTDSALAGPGQGGLHVGELFGGSGVAESHRLDNFVIDTLGAPPAAAGMVFSRRLRRYQHLLVR